MYDIKYRLCSLIHAALTECGLFRWCTLWPVWSVSCLYCESECNAC